MRSVLENLQGAVCELQSWAEQNPYGQLPLKKRYGSCVSARLMKMDITSSAKLMYGFLAINAGEDGIYRGSNEELVIYTSMSYRTVHRSLSTLRSCNLIVRISYQELQVKEIKEVRE